MMKESSSYVKKVQGNYAEGRAGMSTYGTDLAEETLLTSIKEQETRWLRRAVSPLQHRAAKQKELMGTWRVTGSTWFQNLDVKVLLFLIA
eukprot:475991-Pelagomonas_calceolata.AAC.1